MKILDVNDLLEAAQELPNEIFESLEAALEQATKDLAQALADHHGITLHDVSNQPGFGGLCATFRPAHEGQPCPPDIDSGDPSGDWE
jgi:hypothetical protein